MAIKATSLIRIRFEVPTAQEPKIHFILTKNMQSTLKDLWVL